MFERGTKMFPDIFTTTASWTHRKPVRRRELQNSNIEFIENFIAEKNRYTTLLTKITKLQYSPGSLNTYVIAERYISYIFGRVDKQLKH